MRRWRPGLAAIALAAALVAVAATALAAVGPVPARRHHHHRPSAAAPLTRYSLVNGCYQLRLASGQPVATSDGPFRLQAAALGKYLLYGMHDDYVGPSLAPVATPSDGTIWVVGGDAGSGFTLTNLAAGGQALGVTFEPATGCAVFPEAQVDATGTSFTGATPEAAVNGTVESHAHVTAFELFGGDWHCGRPWSPFGAPDALPADCSPYEQGTNGQVEAFVDFGSASRPSDMHGWPTFREWPSPTATAEEGDYYTGIQRAWMAGLRLMVTDLVDNEALCGLMTKRHNPCNDMAAVRIQNADLHALQDYIDAQSGGPGKGWFRIVTDPFQARQVINQGKLAVVEGIEVSRLFGCGEQGNVPQCDTAQIDAGLKEVRDLGIRTFFPVHEFDNAFGGTKMIGGELGTVINVGNRQQTGSFWSLEPCPADSADAPQMTVPAAGALAGLLNGPLASMLGGSPAPVYGPGPQCNTRGLTSLGAYLIRQMITQRMLIQLDHMDSKTADAALAIAQSQNYAGVISAHCCSSAQLFSRMYATGGSVNPPAQAARSFVTQWKLDKGVSSARFLFGFGWGSDLNGLAQQPGPDSAHPIGYPFTSYDGRVTFTREQWGQRVFDLNTDGVANYGLYADWLNQVRLIGGAPVMNDMFHGAEGYLEMWERAYGVQPSGCLAGRGRFSAAGLGALRLGRTWESLLYAAGQPGSRPGRTFRYCATGRKGGISVVFGSGGRAALVLSGARGYRAGGIAVGGRVGRRGPAGAVKLARSNVWLLERHLHGGTRYALVIRGGRVREVGVVAGWVARSARAVLADVHAA